MVLVMDGHLMTSQAAETTAFDIRVMTKKSICDDEKDAENKIEGTVQCLGGNSDESSDGNLVISEETEGDIRRILKPVFLVEDIPCQSFPLSDIIEIKQDPASEGIILIGDQAFSVQELLDQGKGAVTLPIETLPLVVSIHADTNSEVSTVQSVPSGSASDDLLTKSHKLGGDNLNEQIVGSGDIPPDIQEVKGKASKPQEASKKRVRTPNVNSERIYKCDLCSATFNRHGNYSRHRMIHTVSLKDDFRYKCETCGKNFLQRCDLVRHTAVHTGSEPHRCQICNKGYIRASDLRVHMKFHLKQRSFQCGQCDRAFIQSCDLNRHIRSVHLKVKKLTCGHCNRKFTKEVTLLRHMQTSHWQIIIDSLGPIKADVSDGHLTEKGTTDTRSQKDSTSHGQSETM